MGIISTIIGGAIIGALARLLKPGADPMGWILTILFGIGGAWVGSLVFPTSGFLKFVVAIVAAIALLFVYDAVVRKKKV